MIFSMILFTISKYLLMKDFSLLELTHSFRINNNLSYIISSNELKLLYSSSWLIYLSKLNNDKQSGWFFFLLL